MVQTGVKASIARMQEDLQTEYYLWQVHNVVQDISKAEAELANDEADLAGLEATHGKSEAEVDFCCALPERFNCLHV